MQRILVRLGHARRGVAGQSAVRRSTALHGRAGVGHGKGASAQWSWIDHQGHKRSRARPGMARRGAA